MFFILSFAVQLKNSLQVWRNRDQDISVTLKTLSFRPSQLCCSSIYRKHRTALFNITLNVTSSFSWNHMLSQEGFSLFFPSHTYPHCRDTFRVEKIQNLSDAACPAFMEKMKQVNLSSLPNSSPARYALTKRAIGCLVICVQAHAFLFVSKKPHTSKMNVLLFATNVMHFWVKQGIQQGKM